MLSRSSKGYSRKLGGILTPKIEDGIGLPVKKSFGNKFVMFSGEDGTFIQERTQSMLGRKDYEVSAAFELTRIGRVESPLTDPAAAPKQGDEGAPAAWIVFDVAVVPAMDGLDVGDEILVLTWLHLARRDILRVHPRGDRSRSQQGVFSTRSPDRPNPIGLHQVEVISVESDRLCVRNLEAIHGTPVVDVKPVLGKVSAR